MQSTLRRQKICPSSGATRALIFFPFRARSHEPGSGAVIFQKREALFPFFGAADPAKSARTEHARSIAEGGGAEYRPLGEVPPTH